MTEWLHKATPKKVSFEETRDLALNDGFLARSAFEQNGSRADNTRHVKFGDVIHMYFTQKTSPASTITEASPMNRQPKNRMRPIHPGEILREEFLEPLGMSARKLADALGVPPNRVTAILAGRRDVTADTALRLAVALNTTPEFWMNLQKTYELRVAEEASDVSNVRQLVGVLAEPSDRRARRAWGTRARAKKGARRA